MGAVCHTTWNNVPASTSDVFGKRATLQPTSAIGAKAAIGTSAAMNNQLANSSQHPALWLLDVSSLQCMQRLRSHSPSRLPVDATILQRYLHTLRGHGANSFLPIASLRDPHSSSLPGACGSAAIGLQEMPRLPAHAPRGTAACGEVWKSQNPEDLCRVGSARQTCVGNVEDNCPTASNHLSKEHSLTTHCGGIKANHCMTNISNPDAAGSNLHSDFRHILPRFSKTVPCDDKNGRDRESDGIGGHVKCMQPLPTEMRLLLTYVFEKKVSA
jgi:hypothetical protein